ncbi:hypothetical protein [Nostoc sp.]|uniref:hypothetical protein n=1 Tax=Nostoc sp. TaxID=1180 RepID=UPI002FF8315A
MEKATLFRGLKTYREKSEQTLTFGWLMGYQRLIRDARVIARNIRDFYLSCYDPHYTRLLA